MTGRLVGRWIFTLADGARSFTYRKIKSNRYKKSTLNPFAFELERPILTFQRD